MSLLTPLFSLLLAGAFGLHAHLSGQLRLARAALVSLVLTAFYAGVVTGGCSGIQDCDSLKVHATDLASAMS